MFSLILDVIFESSDMCFFFIWNIHGGQKISKGSWGEAFKGF